VALGSSRRTVLVTGAAGFIGSHLVDRLLAENFEVVGIDSLLTGDLTNLSSANRDPHFHFQMGDVREPLNVHAEIIFNMACPASPVHYQHDPYATLTTSVVGAQRLIDMARGMRSTIVQASTSEVYGDPTVHPQPESYWGNVNPIGPRACYDEGKRAAETLLVDAKRMWNIFDQENRGAPPVGGRYRLFLDDWVGVLGLTRKVEDERRALTDQDRKRVV
jgi:UDP-glucuronate decarboxylase